MHRLERPLALLPQHRLLSSVVSVLLARGLWVRMAHWMVSASKVETRSYLLFYVLAPRTVPGTQQGLRNWVLFYFSE